MPPSRVTQASAPGKVILFGEHAVVYGRPAIAVPVAQAQATATISSAPPGAGIRIHAQDLGRTHLLGQPTDEACEALELIVVATLQHLDIQPPPDLEITIRSTIPIGSGMGSGAAVSAAMVRALAEHLAQPLPPEEVSQLVYQTEVLYHGTPSGIDNTVVSHAKPVYFVRGQGIEVLRVGRPFRLAIGDTGVFSPTKVAVADVRRAWEADRARYEGLFDAMGDIARQAREAITTGQVARLGPLMDQNQDLLRQIGVSSPELERLIGAALGAGALGAKLCGAGRGGNMIALVPPEAEGDVVGALREAGARRAMLAEVA